MEQVSIENEVDSTSEFMQLIRGGGLIVKHEGVQLSLRPSHEGRSFGFTEVIEIGIQIGVGVSSGVIAELIRASVKGIIRRARAGESRGDGSKEGIAAVVDKARSEKHLDSE